MCWTCDNPGGDPLRHLHELMVRHRWAVQGWNATASTRPGPTPSA